MCLSSVTALGVPAIYVDSGSSDGSVALARSLGVEALELDPSRPFSAARARNEGFALLSTRQPQLGFVQFVDGDCELFPAWLARGVDELAAHPEAAAVCGRVRERHPEASPYNRLCGLEWQMPEGEVDACGGNFLIRAAAFRGLGGFRADVVAGEEPELCLRLRRAGQRVRHVPDDMVWHDSALLRLGQWWQRARRTGHSYAQGAAMHGSSAERHYVRDCRRIWFWGFVMPALSLGLAWSTRGASLALLVAYPLQVLRIARGGRARGWSAADARLYAFFALLAKFPGLQGILDYQWRRLRGRPMTIIEHKGTGPA